MKANVNKIYTDPALLRQLHNIEKTLQKLKYPDSKRIAIEIIDYNLNSKSSINKIIKELKTGKPWDYIRGWTEFKDLRIFVNKHTLIPRIETENLVNIAAKKIKNYIIAKNPDNINIVDIGTGSGNIIIALYQELEEWLDQKQSNKKVKITYFGSDISSKALKIAKKNIKFNNTKIEIIHSDLLSNFNHDTLRSVGLFIVSNPPYIPHRVYRSLDKSVKKWEPKKALIGGKTGTDYYANIKKHLESINLKPKNIFFEIDPAITESFNQIYPKAEIIKDFKDNNRYAVIKKP